jgi:hypothetical protein
MTAAVCIACGAMKFGAWTPCPKCQEAPATEADRVRALMLSDHHHTRAELKDIQRAIKAGSPPEFDEQQVAELAAQLSRQEHAPLPTARPIVQKMPWFLSIQFLYVLLGILWLGIGLAIFKAARWLVGEIW